MNATWLTRAAANEVDVGAWRAGFRVAVPVGGEPITFATETDPLHVLKMGSYFDTCLSLDTGSNAASTLVNALDVNKHVIYGRRADGAVVCRKLIGATARGELAGYRRSSPCITARWPGPSSPRCSGSRPAAGFARATQCAGNPAPGLLVRRRERGVAGRRERWRVGLSGLSGPGTAGILPAEAQSPPEEISSKVQCLGGQDARGPRARPDTRSKPQGSDR